MPKTVDNYIIQKQLFKDTFLIQYFSCEHKILKKPFTIKKIEKAIESCGTKQQEKHKLKLSFAYSCIQNEIQISREFKSQKKIKCLKILKAKNAVYAVYDQHPERTLQKILITEYLTSQKKQTILNQIINLLRELHDQNIVLGNLSLSNLFFTPDLKLSISNFLIARVLEDSEEARIDQYFLDKDSQYYAPELLKKGILTKSADIYSLGKIIKNLKFEKSDNEFLSPVKFAFQSIKDLLDKMVDLNPQNRPSTAQFQKQFRLNKSRNKSTCGSSGSRDNEEKIVDIKGLQRYKSEATLKYFNQKTDQKTLLHHDSKKTLLSKRQSLNEDIQIKTSPKRIALKSRATLDFQFPLQSSRTLNFEATVVKRQKDLETSRNSKMGASINRFQSSFTGGSRKQVVREISLLRNIVSFLIEMILFVRAENGSKNLCYFLVQQALFYTNSLLKILDSLSKEEMTSTKNFYQFLEECQREKRKLTQIALFFSDEAETKKSYEFELIEQLRKFGRKLLEAYSSDFSIQKHFSQVSQTTYGSKFSNVKENPKTKENQEKLFKSFMLLKRLEYGTYLEFFRAKTHYSNKKFWNEHYFEFQKTFGGKYFAVQIRDLIAKK